MFPTKTKICAASILGVLILLAGSLVSFTIYFVAKSNSAYDGSSVGYILVGSYEESTKLSQLLLRDKLVQHALVVPTLIGHRKEFPSKTVTVTTPSHLLLVQTSFELIPDVKAFVKKVSRGSNIPPVVFTPVVKGDPYLFYGPAKPPRSHSASGAASGSTDESSGANADRQIGGGGGAFLPSSSNANPPATADSGSRQSTLHAGQRLAAFRAAEEPQGVDGDDATIDDSDHPAAEGPRDDAGQDDDEE